ncbi:hypothetical protein SAMN05660653_03202 [Desulfonatronum thiosulfatophilum]|uniref:Uncharacterized protein n=1 Tax=Desulfonatronum thiosulfatophilum TaxID=617002 RepID=A0A1G6EVJ5_9BACT|nr:hypothetical protein SAMN05660653_03202 [Desulfonatronum thiosulfatophilum]
MGGGGDYGVFAEGRYHITKAILELNEWLAKNKEAAVQSE